MRDSESFIPPYEIDPDMFKVNREMTVVMIRSYVLLFPTQYFTPSLSDKVLRFKQR